MESKEAKIRRTVQELKSLCFESASVVDAVSHFSPSRWKQRKSEAVGGRPVVVSFCPSQIQHGLLAVDNVRLSRRNDSYV